MKKLIPFVLIVIISNVAPAQKITNNQAQIEIDYLARSRNQKIGAYFLLAIGLAAGTVGGIGFQLDSDFGGSSSKGAILLVVSGSSLIGTALLFSSAAKNKKKANSLSIDFRFEKTIVNTIAFIPQKFPAAALRLNF